MCATMVSLSNAVGEQAVQDNVQDPARDAVLQELRTAALATYGEERAAEAPLRAALEAAATAVWRLVEAPLSPTDLAPYQPLQPSEPPRG